jgi:hypothetical protein
MPHVLFDEGYPDQMVPDSGVSRSWRFLFIGHTERICIVSSCFTRPTNSPAGDARMSEEANEFVTNRVAAEISWFKSCLVCLLEQRQTKIRTLSMMGELTNRFFLES